jgi:hypothetical protein
MNYKFLLLPIIFFWMACGYSLQTSKSPLLLKAGIRKIYIPPVVNNTYKAGVENVVYNNLVRTLASQKRVVLVQNPKDADAVLNTSIVTASYGMSAGTSVSGLNPSGLSTKLSLPTASYVIATEYSATLTCNFSLSETKQENDLQIIPEKRKKPYSWYSGFSRSKTFPASNQLDVPGTTSPLINESEFERALSDLAASMMYDVHEAMLAMF